MNSKKNEIEKKKKELILLYMGIKLRKESDVIIKNKINLIQVVSLTDEQYNEEKEELKNLSLLDIVNYIKNSIDVMVKFKVEDLIDNYKSNLNENENIATNYETLLQKEEAAIRKHISYEHQIKIEYEKLIEKLEVIELENKVLSCQLVSK